MRSVFQRSEENQSSAGVLYIMMLERKNDGGSRVRAEEGALRNRVSSMQRSRHQLDAAATFIMTCHQ